MFYSGETSPESWSDVVTYGPPPFPPNFGGLHPLIRHMDMVSFFSKLITFSLTFPQMFHACSEALDVMSQLKAQAATWAEDLAKSKRGKGIPFTCPSLKGNSHLECFKEGTRTLERCLPTSSTTFPRTFLTQKTLRPMTMTRLASPPALDLPVELLQETLQVSCRR